MKGDHWCVNHLHIFAVVSDLVGNGCDISRKCHEIPVLLVNFGKNLSVSDTMASCM